MPTQFTEVSPQTIASPAICPASAASDTDRHEIVGRGGPKSGQRFVLPPPRVWAGLASPRRLAGQVSVVAMLLFVGGVVAWSVRGSTGEGMELLAGAGPSTTSTPVFAVSSAQGATAGSSEGVPGAAVLDQPLERGFAPASFAPGPITGATTTTSVVAKPKDDDAAGATDLSLDTPPRAGAAEKPTALAPPSARQMRTPTTAARPAASDQTDLASPASASQRGSVAEPAKPTTPTSRQRPGTQPSPLPTTTQQSQPNPTKQPRSTTITVKPDPGASGTGAQSGTLLFEDNFDRLDASIWAVEHSTYGDGNNELQCYRPENVSVAGGKLVLRAKTENYTCPGGSTRQVTSGMVRSRGVTFAPGQAIEFRVKLTPNNDADQGGLWPAVWSSGFGNGGWPQSGEIDFLEVMTANNPKRSVYSIHYAKPGGGHGVTNRPVVGSANFSAQWHVVRFEYGINGRLVWFLDGRQVHSVDSAATLQGYPSPFDLPIREVKVNLALGGRPGPLAAGAVGSGGATFEMDYLRIYSL